MKFLGLVAASFLVASTATVQAEVCDYRPSQLVGGGGATAIGSTGAATAGLGLAIKGAGFYTLTHATAATTMVGSTLAGASGAGTVGIIAGTGGVIGTVTAVVTAPVTITVGAITAAGIAIYEGSCYFSDERITEYNDVLKVLMHVAQTADPRTFQLHKAWSDETASITVRMAEDVTEVYKVKNLYIVNGVLKHRDWGLNTTIGNLYQIE